MISGGSLGRGRGVGFRLGRALPSGRAVSVRIILELTSGEDVLRDGLGSELGKLTEDGSGRPRRGKARDGIDAELDRFGSPLPTRARVVRRREVDTS